VRGPAILLMGPTGAGKTDLAAALVEHFPLEIVSVDAAMVFRGMDIGTAKPGPALLARAPHHLVDLIDPADSYSAARFLADAGAAIRSIESRGNTPLLVGGTMLYFRAFRSGLARLPPADPALRRRLEGRAAAEGWPALHAELARLDPPSAARIRPGDRQRIQRALEVIERTGRPLSAQLAEDLRGAARADDLTLVLAPADRAALFERIGRRFEAMLAAGLVAEVETLRARGSLHAGLPSMRLIGYRQILEHLEGATTLAEASQKAVAATRQLARRQLTWLRAEPGAEWFDAFDATTPERIEARVAEWFRKRGIPARRC
jgi:tRNA dimethylallyltransferase